MHAVNFDGLVLGICVFQIDAIKNVFLMTGVRG